MNTRRRQRAASRRFLAVMRALDCVTSAPYFTDPILEQLQQCPEAFKVGEMVGKMFDAVKYDHDDAEGGDRLLPPPGLIIPLA